MYKEDTAPTLPQPSGFTGQDPETMEQLFNPQAPQTPQGTPPGGVMVAGDGDVPMPTRGDPQTTPDMPERRDPGAEVTGLIKPDDTRYKDPQNLLVANVMMGGMLPWAQATADVAAGRVPKEKFDEARMEHGRKLAELADQHPDFVEAAQKAMPFLEGLGMGIMKPASTVAGTMARGAAVAAPQGGARGYSSGPVEEPSVSGKRAVAAAGGAAVDATIGAAGAGVAAVGSKIGSLVSESRALKKTAADTAKLDAEARATAATTEAKKLTAETDAARAKSMDKAYVAENKRIQTDYARHTAMPQGGLSQTWQKNREYFATDPTHVYDQMVEKGIGLDGMSKVLNLPPSVIVSRLASKDINKSTPLFQEMMDVHKTMQTFKERGLTAKAAPKTPAASAPETPKAAEPAAPAAEPAAAKPKAAPKPKAPPKEPKAPKAPADPSAPKKPRKPGWPKGGGRM